MKQGNTAVVILIVIILLLIGGGIYFLVLKDNKGNDAPLVTPHPLIKVISPTQGAVISSPLVVRGEARGYWFFEASFPIEILDEAGNRVAMHFAQAQDEWMTESFVPFEGKIEFQTPQSNRGTLVFHKDNPSGLPEHDDSFSIPIKFR